MMEDLSRLSQDRQRAEVERRMREEAEGPFDLASGPLLRVKLLRLDPEEHVLIFTLHHIVSDGWSTGVMIREFSALYGAYLEGRESPLPPLDVQYADYAVWQRKWLQGEMLQRQLGYWKQRLAEAPALSLPTDKPRPAMQSFKGAHESVMIGNDLASRMRALSQSEGVTLFMTLLAGFQTLLHRYSRQDEILVGSPIAGRNRMELEPLIGFFANTLVLRTDLSGDPTVKELLGRVREVCLGAYANQDLPFEQLVDELQPERDLSRNPLFQVAFAIQNVTLQEPQPLPDLTVTYTGVENTTAKFDLTLLIEDRKSFLGGWFEYCMDLFSKDTITRMRDHLVLALEWMVENAEGRVSQFSLLTDAERRQIVDEWNDTDHDYDRRVCLHQLVSRRAELSPHAIAAIYEDQSLSYESLDRQANQIANRLLSVGVTRGDFVGLYLSRSVEMIPALLGILKAGAAYLPLDLSYPPARVEWILSTMRVKAALTQSWHLPLFEEVGQSLSELRDVICLDRGSLGVELSPGVSWRCWSGEQTLEAGDDDPGVEVSSLDIAYVIFTSGSTGTPKGVMAQHRPVVNLIEWVNRSFGIGAKDRALFVTSLCFDLSVYDVFGLLSGGGSIQVVPDEELREPRRLLERMIGDGVTFWDSAPAALQQLSPLMGEAEEEFRRSRLRLVFLSGDWIPIGLPDEVRSRIAGVEVIALGGATEATVWSNFYRVGEVSRQWSSIPYGKPIQNSRYYILDENLNNQPVGVAGDLYIGGECLSLGYINQAEQTATKYIPDEFGRLSGGRIYKTGDLARYQADGNIEFLGRIDHQVKVRGYRIELGEIESALLQHEGIREAVVVARGEARGDKRVVAYLVSEGGERRGARELREYLRESLPEYMIPSGYVWLEKMPVTSNGKLDRSALPEVGEGEGSREQEYVAPSGPVEELLAGIWGEVLGTNEIGAHDNFFEIGGHSLLAMQVISRIKETFRVELPLRAVFELSTVAEMAGQIEAGMNHGDRLRMQPINRADREGDLPLSYAQQRLWFLTQLNPSSAFYNIPVAIKLSGHLKVEALKKAIDELVNRHEALRTVFINQQGRPFQVIKEPEPTALMMEDLSRLSQDRQRAEVERRMREEANEPFDLSQGPLVRGRLLRLSEEEHVLMFTVHHIVSDGWSAGVMIREVGTLYEAYSEGRESPLPELKIQYADYAVWQREWLQGDVLQAQMDYWKERLAGAPVLSLPIDKPRPTAQGFRGAREYLAVSQELIGRLRELSQSEGVTLFMTLLAGFQVLLHRYSGQDDILVGSPIAGRVRAEFEPLIGLFVNSLVLRTDLSGDPTVKELLGRVRETCLGAFTHQDLPFEQLVDELQPERDLSHNPLFQVIFLLDNAQQNDVNQNGLRWSQLPVESAIAKFDIILEVIDRGQRLLLIASYDTDVFEGATIGRMLRHLEGILEGMTTDPYQQISELSLIGEAERQRLEEWSQGNATR
jgi:amino acid adenylation domain-containing protein